MITIDPGHGGGDPGTSNAGVVEKKLALAYGMTLGGELCRLGVPVVYTRTTDVMPGGGTLAAGLRERARISNEAKSDGFVSVHFNASANPEAKGIWLIHAKGSERGRDFADAIKRELGGNVYSDTSGWTGNRRLAVLWKTAAPAVLIEYGFLTNERERVDVQNVLRMRELIERTARAIRMWLD